jgi:beta-mannosidase
LLDILEKVEKLSLNENWFLINKQKTIKVPTEVPGTVFEALIDNIIIEDPFYGLREHEVSWVYESEWEYKTNFDLPPEFLDHKKIILRFHGLDTISEIILNGDSLGHTNNMFTRYDFKVKSKLKNRNNSLIV